MKSSTDSSVNSSSAATTSQKISHLFNHCILVTYQLKQFEFTNHIYISLISNNIIRLAHSIVTLYSISSEYQSVNTTDSQQISENFSQSNLNYSISWFLIKSNLTKTIQHFKDNSTSVLNYFIFIM